MLSEKNEYIKEAVEELDKINQDKRLKEAYLKRQMALMDEATQKYAYFEDGMEKGMEKAKEEIVVNAIKLGQSNEQIYALTDIPEEMIEEMRKKCTP